MSLNTDGIINQWSPSLAVNAAGQALAVQTQRQGFHFETDVAVWPYRTNTGIFILYANHFIVSSGWGTEQALTSNASNSEDFSMVMDSEGNGLSWLLFQQKVFVVENKKA